MSRLSQPKPVKPVAAIFSAFKDKIAQASARLEDRLGPIDYVGETGLFNQTEYYSEEMGRPLYKRLLAAENLIDPAELVAVKIFCQEVEAEFSLAGKRTVNLDPGYVAAEKLILATGKAGAHRIYLSRGVWADLTLIFQHGRFRPLPWTYPDYAAGPTLKAVSDIRKKYLYQLRTREKEEK